MHGMKFNCYLDGVINVSHFTKRIVVVYIQKHLF
jgi:hypothetical protein